MIDLMEYEQALRKHMPTNSSSYNRFSNQMHHTYWCRYKDRLTDERNAIGVDYFTRGVITDREYRARNDVVDKLVLEADLILDALADKLGIRRIPRIPTVLPIE